MLVKEYLLYLDIDSEGLKFDGKVSIGLESDKDVQLDSVELEIVRVEADKKTVPFQFSDGRLTVKTGHFEGTVEVWYNGRVSEALVGLYKAPYENTYNFSTQFEAANARRMFPCVDHPDYKAEFTLALKINRELEAISNTPIESIRLEDGKKVVTFQKTPRMSTYLLYLGVGKFQELIHRLGNTDVVVATTPGNANRGEFALDVAKGSIEFYSDYFAIPYMLPKLHLIAVPEFAMGGMENWGAITFRETALLADVEKSSVKAKKRVADVVAHEIAHQWFGDLVTMSWWDDIWLNESFATFMSYKARAQLYPDWKVWEGFLRDEVAGAMVMDSMKNTHPIKVNVKSPEEIEEIFDDISYNKGASILRMIDAYIEPGNFMEGVRRFLASHKYANATGKDLWDALEETSGKRVKNIMETWIGKPGYPVITVAAEDNRLILKQERFLLSGESQRDIRPVPVTMELNGETRSLLMETEEEKLDLKDIRSLKLNVDQTGFYRVFYGDLYGLLWKCELSAEDNFRILDDAYAFLLSGKMSLSDYLEILEMYRYEQDYLPAFEVSDQLDSLTRIIPSKVTEFSKRYHRDQLNLLENRTDVNSSMLRGIMAGRLAVIDELYAKELGGKIRQHVEVEPDMKDPVAVAYARAYNDQEEILKRYRASQTDEERVRLLSALMNLTKYELIESSLKFILGGELKKQDVRTAIILAAMNPDAKDLSWMWIKENLEKLRRIYEGTGTLSRTFQAIIPIMGIGKVDEVENFFRQHSMPEAGKGIRLGLEKLKIYDRLAEKYGNHKIN
jgi:tricorn protease interacting factor F2/3